MPSHQQNLDAVRLACSKTNPLQFYVAGDAQRGSPVVMEKVVTAADVLLALGERYGHSDSGWCLTTRGDLHHIFADETPGRLDLRATLSSWDETTVAALANLLVR